MLTDEWNWDEYMEVALEEAHEKGIERGIEKGIEQGIERGIEQTVRNFLAIGITIDNIVKATGLPLEKVRIMASEGEYKLKI
jgi:predicted transposase/invertase (TIGR01784 family)